MRSGNVLACLVLQFSCIMLFLGMEWRSRQSFKDAKPTHLGAHLCLSLRLMLCQLLPRAQHHSKFSLSQWISVLKSVL